MANVGAEQRGNDNEEAILRWCKHRKDKYLQSARVDWEKVWKTYRQRGRESGTELRHTRMVLEMLVRLWESNRIEAERFDRR